jgi:riboflavin-specific deaminase-like protein
MRSVFSDLLGSTREDEGAALLSARDIAEGLYLQARSSTEHSDLPYVLLNMVSTTDGRARIHGRSGEIGNRSDRELFHELRATVDGVMIGAQTLRTERYNGIVADPELRQLRARRGLAQEPFACVLSASLDIPTDVPLLADPAARVVILTPSGTSLPPCAAHVDYIRSEPGVPLHLPTVMGRLRERFGIRTLLCEGGPHLNGQLLRAGLVDELLLCFAPKLAGECATEPSLPIVAGVELDPPLPLQLVTAFESEGYLFLRYGVRSRERVSRETTPSSSLAK